VFFFNILISKCEAEKGGLKKKFPVIQFNKLSGHDFYFSNLSGNIRGSLLGDPATYTITADSLSGKQNLPNFGNGKNSLEVSTASGNIDIEFLPVN